MTVRELADYLTKHPEVTEVVLSKADQQRLSQYTGVGRVIPSKYILFSNVKFRTADEPGLVVDWSESEVIEL